MAKQFQFDVDARKELMSGIDTLTAAVDATLGPAGRSAALDKEFGHPFWESAFGFARDRFADRKNPDKG